VHYLLLFTDTGSAVIGEITCANIDASEKKCSGSSDQVLPAMNSIDVNNTCTVSDETVFEDLTTSENIETITTLISPRKHSRLQEEVRNLTQSKQLLTGKLRRLQKQVKDEQSKVLRMQEQFKKIFTVDQIKAIESTTTRGRKWSQQTIQKALQLLFACGPSGYAALKGQGYPVPATRTLRKSIEVIKFDGGILGEVFELLKLKAANLHDKEKDCALTLDEMSITTSTEFDTRTGRLMGQVTLPGHSGQATHAMVFMLAGISSRWKQTVAYYFTGNSVFGSALKPIILNIIREAHEVGLHVVSVTSDMGACNRAMWNSFGISCGRLTKTVNRIPHPCISDKHLYFLADAPHVIKNLKAAIVNGQDISLPDWAVKDNKLSCGVVTANHLQKLLDFQENLQLKISPGLTSKTLKPSHFEKMKVSNAMSLFSHSNSAGLAYLVEQGYSTDLLTTSWFLKTINKWFDLVSSRRRLMALSLRRPEKYNEATDFLRNVIHLFETLTIGSKAAWKPVQTGVILTTQSLLGLSDDLLSRGYKFVLTSRFTSDCIENLFSCVRTNNPIPTPLEFKNKLRLLSVAQYMRVKSSSSYSVDSGSYLADFIASCKSQATKQAADPEPEVPESIALSDARSLPETELASLYYLAGYIVSRILKSNGTCDHHVLAVKAAKENLSSDYASLIRLNSYKDDCLVSCSSVTFDLFRKAEDAFRSVNLKLLHYRKNVRKLLLDCLRSACSEVELPECHNVKDVILNRFVTFRLRIWAKAQRAVEKAKTHKADNGELGSKSMAMHAAVSKYK